MSGDDARHMTHALALGRRGLGRVWPWPSVGCVIVKDGRVVGRGVSDIETRRHGEIVALAQAGDAAKGATAFVTLEPCSHTGSTPPCADSLVNAGISRVVAAMMDPNPKVAGQGIAHLRDAGITVDVGLGEAEARRQHRGFLTVLKHGRPSVTLKLASTLDGRIATESGESRWITGPEARRMVHALRARHDAVLVGGGTARADNPTLTVRDLGIRRQPLRIVASQNLDLPWPNRLVETIDDGPVWMVHGPQAASSDRWTGAGVRLVEVPLKSGQIDLKAMLEKLAKEGLTRIFCEGGGSFAAGLLSEGLVDEVMLFTAGKVIGAEGRPSVGPLGLDALEDAPAFELEETRPVGADVLQIWRRGI